MYADALAIADAAELLGDPAKAADYRERAAQLKQRVQEELWDPGARVLSPPVRAR